MTQDARNKEQVYDEDISPLMGKIIAICKQRGIAMLCTFAIPTPGHEDLRCTTLLPGGDGANPDDQARAYRALRDDGGIALAMTITTPARG